MRKVPGNADFLHPGAAIRERGAGEGCVGCGRCRGCTGAQNPKNNLEPGVPEQPRMEFPENRPRGTGWDFPKTDLGWGPRNWPGTRPSRVIPGWGSPRNTWDGGSVRHRAAGRGGERPGGSRGRLCLSGVCYSRGAVSRAGGCLSVGTVSRAVSVVRGRGLVFDGVFALAGVGSLQGRGLSIQGRGLALQGHGLAVLGRGLGSRGRGLWGRDCPGLGRGLSGRGGGAGAVPVAPAGRGRRRCR